MVITFQLYPIFQKLRLYFSRLFSQMCYGDKHGLGQTQVLLDEWSASSKYYMELQGGSLGIWSAYKVQQHKVGKGLFKLMIQKTTFSPYFVWSLF